MKRIITIILCLLLGVGAIGGSFMLAKHIDSKMSVEQPSDSSSDGSTDTPNETPDNSDEVETVSSWELCTDVSQLSVGDQIVIAVQSNEIAMGTTKNTSNRSAATIVKDGHSITFGDDVQIITLESGIVDNTFAFNVGTGYLYAPSSASNQLKTHSSIDENSSWAITIDSSCVATITAQGGSTRNVLMYNSASNLFSCYASAQETVVIYKLVESAEN